MKTEEIISEIQQSARQNNGKPLGESLFMKETGLKRSHLWSAGFSNYTDALKAAGFNGNQFNTAANPETVLNALIGLIRQIDKFPTKGHIKVARVTDNSFPSYEAFLTVAGGVFANLPAVLLQYCGANHVTDIVHLIPNKVQRSAPEKVISTSASITGYVYLLKHGNHYKIGRSNDVTRRRREISLILPQELEHVHIIETDDPEGIEAYWHRRFAAKRLRGEWFELGAEDIASFKRRRYQ